MGKNLSLIGMPAAGKSTIGVLLAKYMNMDFVDTDILIQNTEGKRLYEIIEEEGLDKFCQIEEDIVSSMKKESSVIATGGSVVYSEKAMENLKKSGIIVFLHSDCTIVEQRLKDLNQRGVVHKKGQKVSDIYMERVPLYERWADFTVDTGMGRPEQCVIEIMEKVRSSI